ncbi:hypothetical protein BDQ17DRAFT_1389465 [Cyathus striatus]|nr:hypothetical protein BDQ17DRAFT_1389465 [Cyathus striatus]
MHIQPDYSTDFDPLKSQQQQQQLKLNGFGSSNYRSFNSFPNANRPRHHNSQSILGSYRDQQSFFPASGDPYSQQMTSPIQAHIQPYDSRASYDLGPSQQGLGSGVHTKPFLGDTYGAPSGMLSQSHLNPVKGVHQQQHASQATYSGYTNGMQLSVANPAGAGPVSATGVSASGPSNGTGASSNQEEISTIFVVGFPDDMQEREFQNMFTFSPGFEAATLKIPNKEYTAYSGVMGTARGYQPYTGSNDPYNLVTVNQAEDGTVSSWPAVDDGSAGGPYMGGPGGSAAPRKQIIGFAKFRSREAALEARDILQGRRVDIEKGAVLKAEMAKKNLHTKRGVGPVQVSSGTSANGAVGVGGGLPSALANPSILSGLQQGLMSGLSGDHYGLTSGISENGLTPRERELGTIGAIGLGMSGGRINQWPHQDLASVNGQLGGPLSAEDERRERQAGMLNHIGVGSGRGPRERAEEEERERRRKERLRTSNQAAFDAFHSVPPGTGAPSGLSRQLSSANGANVNGGSASLLQPPMDNGPGSSLGSSPLLGNAYAAPPGLSSHQHQQQQHEEVMGPWDKVNKPVPAAGSINMAPARPRSPSQLSSSPPSNPGSHALDQPRAFSPSLEKKFHESGGDLQLKHQTSSGSSASSVTGGPSSATAEGSDSELTRDIEQLELNTNNGTTSPQLPSPASGASSASARSGVDQNPPINTLYVGNLPASPPPVGYPPDYLEECLRDLFSRRPGFRRLSFRQKSNGPMCFVEFEDVHYATKALNDLYGNTLNGLIKGGGIRLSYSKNPLGVRTPTNTGSGNILQNQQQQMQAIGTQQGFGGPFTQDVFAPRIDDQSRLRNGLAIGGSHNFNNNFLASPPPRFFSTSPGSSNAFSPTSSTPVTASANTFAPRGNGGSMSLYNGYNLGGNNIVGTSPASFSPFGITSPIPHQSIPEQTLSSEDTSSHSP